MEIQTEETLPKDQERACLIGRAWIPGNPGGPSPIWIHQMKVYDLSPHFPTISDLLEEDNPARKIPECSGMESIGKLEDLLGNTPIDHRDTNQPWLLAPCDLQALKASAVTYV